MGLGVYLSSHLAQGPGRSLLGVARGMTNTAHAKIAYHFKNVFKICQYLDIAMPIVFPRNRLEQYLVDANGRCRYRAVRRCEYGDGGK